MARTHDQTPVKHTSKYPLWMTEGSWTAGIVTAVVGYGALAIFLLVIS